MSMEYGKETEVKTLDREGSTVTSVRNYLKGEVKRPLKKHYEMKVRVHSADEELEQYTSFSVQFNRDKTMLDPFFKIERSSIGSTNGYYYCVKCWTELIY